MSAAFYDGYGQMMRQVILDRCGRGMMLRVSALLAAVAIGAPLLLRLSPALPRFGGAVAACAAAAGILLWCGTWLRSAARQNQPEYAGLVPQLRRRLMVLTVLVLVATTLLVSALLAAVFGHFGYLLAGIGLFCVYMLFVQRYMLLVFLPSAVILASVSVQRRLEQLIGMAAAAGEPVVAGVGLIVVAALGAWGLLAVFPRGGDNHWTWHRKLNARLARQRNLAPSAGAPAASGMPRWVKLWCTASGTVYRATLRRDNRRAVPASAARMMMHTVGVEGHHGVAVGGLLLLALMTVLLVLYLGPDVRLVQQMAQTSVIQMSVLLAPLTYAGGAACAISRRGTEQSLYLLTPGAPRAAALNRLLARTLLTRFLLVWLAAFACAAGLDAAIVGGPPLRGATFVMAMAVLPFGLILLRDYAGMPFSYNHTMILGGCFAGAVVYLVAMQVERSVPGMPWFWLGGALALLSVLAMGLRWQRMMALPQAFPAGRLAV
ncbi:hypothetical protein [Duganella sp. LjRoot269]|jgi:hypothetical protein|uniref:hypothetical protein n=1 Tax=Duganella sp. LjRoot269 TaxID=3342305 RepID=UPI003ECD1A62